MKAITVKTVFKILIVSFGVIVFNACHEGGKLEEDLSMSEVDITEKYETIENFQLTPLKLEKANNQVPKNLKIIKTANSRYKVKDVKTATHHIKKMAFAYEAYISDLRFENDQYKREMRFTIKIPAFHFDSMMDSIHVVSEFTDFENITTSDVTEEYVDLQTRLKTKLEVKERYEVILRKNAKTVEDILATEDKLRVIQEEIESAQGRLSYLTSKVSYSTIQIDLYESVDFKAEPEVYSKSFWIKTKEGLAFGWNLIEAIIIGVLHIWPLIFIGILVMIFIRYRMKKGKRA